MDTRERNAAYTQKTEWLLVKNGEREERREADVHAAPSYSAYPTPERFPDKLPPDYPAILSLLFSVISICWNNAFFSWLSVAFICGSFAGIKFNEIDYTQIVVSCCFSIMGIIRNHVFPDIPAA